MSTRGTVGFRKYDRDKLVYNHYDSYPGGLGKDTINFIRTCAGLDLLQNLPPVECEARGYNGMLSYLYRIYDQLRPVRDSDKVPEGWLEYYAGYIPTKLERPIEDWDNLMRHVVEARGGVPAAWLDPAPPTPEQDVLLNIIDAVAHRPKQVPVIHFADAGDFIKDSLFCEYGYIINLDTNVLEFWVGAQDRPSYGNRYGTCSSEIRYTGATPYWPCLKVAEYQLALCMSDPNGVLAEMEKDKIQYEKAREDAERADILERAIALGFIKPKPESKSRAVKWALAAGIKKATSNKTGE